MKELFDIEVKHTPPKMPWFNPYAERFHQSLKNELLSRIAMQEATKIRDECIHYQENYNNLGPHQGIDGKQISKETVNVVPIRQSEKIRFAKKSGLDGLVTRFELVA